MKKSFIFCKNTAKKTITQKSIHTIMRYDHRQYGKYLKNEQPICPRKHTEYLLNFLNIFQEASFHVSLLWCLGDRRNELMALLPQFCSKFEDVSSTADDNLGFALHVEQLFCKIGNKLYKFQLWNLICLLNTALHKSTKKNVPLFSFVWWFFRKKMIYERVRDKMKWKWWGFWLSAYSSQS